jgi:hypothetical protein
MNGLRVKVVKAKNVPLWALIPALKSREIAKRYLANAEKILGRPLNSRERAYLHDVVEQGNNVEAFLKGLGYFEDTNRGRLLRTHGISVESDKEAMEILERLEEEGTNVRRNDQHERLAEKTEN